MEVALDKEEGEIYIKDSSLVDMIKLFNLLTSHL